MASRHRSSSGRSAAKGYTTQEFRRLTGIPQRRLRSWTAAGVLPPPVGRGRAARYSDTHVLLAKGIAKLRSQGVALRDVRLRLARLDRSELVALSRPPVEERTGQPEPPPEPSYPSTRWEVVELMSGLVLMVNPDKGPVLRRVADEIYRHYSVKSQ